VDEVPEFYGWFDDDAPDGLPVEMLVIERAIDTLSGPWTVAGALILFGDAPPAWVDGYVDDYWSADAPQLWEYFVDKGGGNAYSYEIAFLRLRSPEDASAVLAHMESKLAEGHPLGLSAPVSPPMETVPDTPAAEIVDEPADPCDDHIHVDAPFAIADVATWQLAVELVRRHPDDLWIIRTYPMDGHYDCLSIRRAGDILGSPGVALNRNGTHVHVSRLDIASGGEARLMSWGDGFATADPRDWVRELESAAGLRAPVGGPPPTTRSSIALRWIGGFLRLQLGSRQRWTAWNDWSELDYGETAADFDAIPAARQWLRERGRPEAAAEVWFVGTEPRPGDRQIHFALNSAGTLWTASGGEVDLLAAYRRSGSSITQLLVATASATLS
jgi:hypothetical protein